jgi:hypothetical protein
VHWLFLLFGLWNIAGLQILFVVFPIGPLSNRLMAVLALLGLGWWWRRGYRRGRFPLLSPVLEGAILFLVGAVMSEPNAALGLFYSCLLFRSLYGSWRHDAFTVVFTLLALLGDVRAIRQRTEQLQQSDPQLEPFVQEVQQLAKTLQIDAPRDLLREYHHTVRS